MSVQTRLRQGADGDYYYILDSGRADVLIRKGAGVLGLCRQTRNLVAHL